MKVTVRADDDVMVNDERLAAGASRDFTGDTISITKAEAPRAPADPTDDVFSPANRPNGLMTAGVAPKMPKSGGELEQQVIAPGVVVERQVAPRGEAEQGGGPNAEISKEGFKTPGPQPDNADVAGAGGLTGMAGATGDVDARGAPMDNAARAKTAGVETTSTKSVSTKGTRAKSSTTSSRRKG